MNYSRKKIDQKIENITSSEERQKNRFVVFLITLAAAAGICLLVIGFAFGAGSVSAILDNAPSVVDLDQLNPSSTKSIIYASDGSIMQELIRSGSNRESVSYDALPENLINAIVAVEDERFFEHDGVDIKGIIRALFTDIASGSFAQGASTITQQLIKNNLFEGGYETNFGDKIERKIQEQYTAVKVEQELDKTQILEYYLNTINFGSSCLGVQTAAKRYFGKDVSELDLAECTVLAAIPKNPTHYNPIKHPEDNQTRRLLVLSDMLEQGYITQDEYDEASSEDVYKRIQTVSETTNTETVTHAFSYFTDTVFTQVEEALETELGYTETQAYNAMYSGGLRIYTTEDPEIQSIVEEEVNDESNYIVQNADGSSTDYLEYSLEYRLTTEDANGNSYYYDENNLKSYYQDILGNTVFKLTFTSKDELQAAVDDFRNYITLTTGTETASETVTATIEPQTSCIVIDQKTGYVQAVVGGRGDKDEIGSLTLNRAVDSTRQPGSCFKIIVSYGPALDTGGATLSTTYYDSQLLIDSRSIANWWGTQYLGYASIHFGIIASMNIVAVKCMEETATENVGYTYAQNFGITTLVEDDKTPLMAIGSIAYGVSNMELTAAYASIANGGVYNEPIFWTKVTDADGNVLLTNSQASRTVLKNSTAKLLTMAMEDTISPEFTPWPDQGVGATSANCAIPNMAAAGKSGTTNDANDIWFVGYTPYHTMGIWSGYDSSKSFGSSPGYHKNIWQKIMARISADEEPASFDYSGLETAVICSKSGLLAKEGVCDATGDSSCHVYTEYFAPGTAPTEYCNRHVSYSVCKESGDLSSPFCPEKDLETRVFITIDPEDDDGIQTVDTAYTLPDSLKDTICTVHDKDITDDEDEDESGDEKEKESSDEKESTTEKDGTADESVSGSEEEEAPVSSEPESTQEESSSDDTPVVIIDTTPEVPD